MRKIILNGLIAFSVGLLVTSVIGYLVTVPQKINVRDVKIVQVSSPVSQSMNVKDKVVVQKTVSNMDYLNAWKLSATIIGKKPLAMVLKGRDSRVLQLKNTLEGYEVKEIHKDKVLFSSASNDVWLYIKKQKVSTNNPGVTQVMPRVGVYNIRITNFKRNVLQPERLLKTINIMPDIQEGKFHGLKVVSLLEGSFLYMNGLRQNDVIKKINGKKLLSISDGIAAYQGIASSTKFSISVLRDNKIEELKYEIVK